MENGLLNYFGFILMAVSIAGLIILMRRARSRFRTGAAGMGDIRRSAKSRLSAMGDRRDTQIVRRIPADGRPLSESDERFLAGISDWQNSVLKSGRQS